MSSLSEQQENCTDKECFWCLRDLFHPYSGPPIYYTTVIISKSGKVYDLGKREGPGGDEFCINAYTCTVEEAERLKSKCGKK